MSLADPVNQPLPGRPICADCDHCDRGSCARPIGTHFDAGTNGYRKRLNVSAALERSRNKTLTGRVTCGPEGQFFEPKGSSAPMVAPAEDAQNCDGDFIVPADPLGEVMAALRRNPPEVIAWAQAATNLGKDPTMTDEQIRQMVNRFLAWKLPQDFAPDGGISFEPVACKGTPHEFHFAPTGTNLFTATQAERMVRHMLVGAFIPTPRDTIADSDGDDGA